MGKTKPLNEVPSFRNFIAARDRAIEEIMNQAIAQGNDLLRGTLSQSVALILGQYESMRKATNPAVEVNRLNASLMDLFEALAQQVARIQAQAMRRAQYLAMIGTAEALGRARAEIQSAPAAPPLPTRNEQGEPILGRVRLSLAKIQRDLTDAVQASLWLEEDLEEMRRRLGRALPRRRALSRPKRVLKPLLKEAETPEQALKRLLRGEGVKPQIEPSPSTRDYFVLQTPMVTQGILNDELWGEIIDAVKQEYVPAFRGPEDKLFQPRIGERGEEIRYAWEWEQDSMHELVRSTVQGENEAAKANGVTSFVWIAIVDDRTDECCLWRDGLTVEEIATALQNEHSDDECQAFAPPAHHSCRCRLAPVLDSDDIQPPESNLPEFDEWLNTIGK